MLELTTFQFSLIYNAFSFTIATMGAATIFFFVSLNQLTKQYRTAVTVTGLVTLIAFYHYIQIFHSWGSAYTVLDQIIKPTGTAFNDVYRYVDWLLTVPLLLVELILVMNLPRKETYAKATRLGLLAALMIVLGYPGEVTSSDSTRTIFWVLAMIPFVIIVFDLFFGLRSAIERQPPEVRGMVSAARWITVLSWSFYPVVYLFPVLGLQGGNATTAVQIGYTIADIVSKVGFGLFIYVIALRKSEALIAREPMPDANPGMVS